MNRIARAMMKVAWMAAVVGLVAHAETLYDREGIQLQGTARVVAYEAGTCRVLEERHSEAEYEDMKANHGRPLHVWQLDFSAYNGTGKALSYLRAGFEIESEWPPCTNWSGPSGNYSKPVLWAGSFQLLQKPSGMEPGEVVRDTIFLLVFHEHQPVFKKWGVNFGLEESGERETDAAPTRPAPVEHPVKPSRDIAPSLLSSDRSSKSVDMLRQGEIAEDNGDYKTAEELLSQVCGLSDERLPDPRACMRLAKFHAVQGEFNKAGKVLRQLLKTLRLPTSSQPLKIVEALLLHAEVYAAQSQLDSAAKTLHEVIPLLNKLTQPKRSRALARMSGFYLAANNPIAPNDSNRMELNNRNQTAREFGTRLLEQAQAGLEAERDFEPAEYVTAATEVAGFLNAYGQKQAAKKLDEKIKEWREKIPQSSRDRPSPVKKVGGDILSPRLLHKQEPSYTPGARDAGVEGTVVLTIQVWPDGRAHKIRVIRHLPFGLSWAAIQAVRAWRFVPGSKSGEPVKVAATVEVNFRLLSPR
ncbi:MAG: energy transducer TonB [Bryobacterales bacterium]|nr:energy transducer TonB [Bryobacterales bacterium]